MFECQRRQQEEKEEENVLRAIQSECLSALAMKKNRTKMENQFEEGQKQTSIYFEIEFGFPKIVASFC